MAANRILNLAPTAQGPHEEKCFCYACRNERVARIQRANVNIAMLHRVYFTQLTETRETILDTKYLHTLEEIVIGYTYKKMCLDGSGYVSFGAWMNTRPEFAQYGWMDKLRICDQITQVTSVFEQWQTIVDNLTHPSMAVIEARNFSVNQFYRALCPNWCTRVRNTLLMSRNPVPIRNHEYDNDKFLAIMRLVQTSGLLDDVSHCRQQGRLISNRFAAEIQRMCNPDNI